MPTTDELLEQVVDEVVGPAVGQAIPSAWEPVVANKQKMELIVGREMHPDVFELRPLGSRVAIVREAPPEKSGSIFIPESAQAPLAAGWVFAIGNHMPGWPYERLLGAKVLFGQYAGDVIQVGEPGENLFESGYLLLDALSIWGIVGELPAEPPIDN